MDELKETINVLDDAITKLKELKNKRVSKKLVTKTPKNVQVCSDRLTKPYRVNFNDKSDSSTILAESFESLKDAIKYRDKTIEENIDGVLKGYVPRGITYDKKNNKYNAFLHVNKHCYTIGSYKTLIEAVSEREKAINSLK